MGIVIFWIFCAIISAVIASNKGRSGVGWFFLGLLFGPFGFVVAILPAIPKEPQPAKPSVNKCKECDHIFTGEIGLAGRWICPKCKTANQIV